MDLYKSPPKTLLIWILLLCLLSLDPVHTLTCPGDCECDPLIFEVRCVGRTLLSIPTSLSPDTKSLILQWNLIAFTKATSNNTFLSLSKLSTLDISRNYLDMIPVGLLDPLIALQQLNLEHNRIVKINWNAFRKLKNLKRLYLNRNWISYIEAPISGTTQLNLDLLHLGNNKLHQLSKSDLQSFQHIDTLYLQNNALHTIEPGSFNVTSVRYLNLGANNLSPLGLNLDQISNLEELVVYSNKLNLDSVTLLQGLTSLKVLSMASNSIGNIAAGVFSDLANLQELYLEGNNINIDNLVKELSSLGDMKALGLSSDTLDVFPYWFCDKYPHLSVIHITHSNIRSISAELSMKCSQLKTINLKLNKISVIEPYAFSNISFTYLHLQSNLITSIPSSAFKTDIVGGIADSVEVFLDDNPLNCDCFLQHLIELPKVYKLSGKCSTPPELAGRVVSSVQSQSFICETTTQPLETTILPTTLEPSTTQEATTIEETETTTEPTTQPVTTTETSSSQPSTTKTTMFQTTTLLTTDKSTTAVDTETTVITMTTTLMEQDTIKIEHGSTEEPTSPVPGPVTKSTMVSTRKSQETSQPNVQTVVIKDTNWLWAAYLSAALFAAILLILVVAIIICYQQRIKPGERVNPDVENSEESTKSNGQILHKEVLNGGHIEKEAVEPIYIMEDTQMKIPTQDLTEYTGLHYSKYNPQNSQHPEMQEIPNGNHMPNGNKSYVDDDVNQTVNNNLKSSIDNGNPNGNINGMNGNAQHVNPQSETANVNQSGNVNHGPKRKQSREELKPLETLDASVQDYVFLHGVTDEVTRF